MPQLSDTIASNADLSLQFVADLMVLANLDTLRGEFRTLMDVTGLRHSRKLSDW